eukprot:TRINITY_DN23503_c0_g1_i1.p1 TRINITY_DN23503_c0_g1~~TRINITY_DN23503_c0_g1_i1.p1  ORF type:complete len:377 (-),score=53.67 TRINITY_DN23503_c0_g1_i1:202-1233(-)
MKKSVAGKLEKSQGKKAQQKPPSATKKKPSQSSSSSGTSSAEQTLSRIKEHYLCPITHRLLVDPVVAMDGHVYERKALQRWLAKKEASPTTNQPMGTTVIPSLVARQTVGEMVEGGAVDAESSRKFLSDRGRLRAFSNKVGASGSVCGPDLDGAVADFRRCLEMTECETQRKAIELQLRAVLWMQEGARLFEQARALESNSSASAASLADALGDDAQTWALQIGDAARAAIVWPALRAARLASWEFLPEGTRVRLLDSATELKRLCERPPLGARAKVGWNNQMASFAGQTCKVVRTGEQKHSNYVLKLDMGDQGDDSDSDGGQRTFSFPYDALYLVEPLEAQP